MKPIHVIQVVAVCLVLALYVFYRAGHQQPQTPQIENTFKENFPYAFSDRGKDEMLLDKVHSGRNVALVFLEGGSDAAVFADGREIGPKDFLASEQLTQPLNGTLAAIDYSTTLTVTFGRIRNQLSFPKDVRPQWVGVDTSGPGIRFVYLREGEGYL